MATAIITGSARGIGAAIALRLAQDGFDIALNDLNEGMFEDNDIVDKIKATGVKCETFCADVSDYAQCEEMVNAVKEKLGGFDVLVNNGMASSKREAREFIKNNAISINGEVVTDETKVITKDMALEGKIIIFRRGKKKYYIGMI